MRGDDVRPRGEEEPRDRGDDAGAVGTGDQQPRCVVRRVGHRRRYFFVVVVPVEVVGVVEVLVEEAPVEGAGVAAPTWV